MRFISVVAIAVALMGVNAADAALWNTTAGGVSCGTGCKTFTSTVGGLTLTARAYSTPVFDAMSPYNVSGNWAVANLDVYSGGLGVANTINNSGTTYDVIVFELPAGIWDPEYFKLGWAEGDSDVQAWIGGGSTAIDFTNVCFTGCATELVADLGFVDIGSTMPIVPIGAGGSASPGGASGVGGSNVPLNSQANFNTTKTGRYLVMSGNLAQANDAFKISEVSAGYTHVPVPGSLLLLGLGLVLLTAVRVRPVPRRAAIR